MTDLYEKKTLTLKHSGQRLELHTAQDLFSSHQVDTGTRRLLRTLVAEMPLPCTKVLDLGCGYGPLGLALKAEDPDRTVHLVDRDALALAYARRNAEQNGLKEVHVYGSLGYDAVTDRDFELIVSNIPGKAGEQVITALLREAASYLARGGRVALVIVAPLAALVDQLLTAPEMELLLREERSGHAIFHYGFQEGHRPPPPVPAFERGLYDRDRVTIETEKLAFPMQTVRGLPEFDTLSYRTALLIEGLENVKLTPRRALLCNPGQGHAAVALWRRFRPAALTLVDRDLLALHATRRNLEANGCPAAALESAHQVGMVPEDGTFDLIAGLLRETEGPEILAHDLRGLKQHLSREGHLLLAGSSTAITRLEKVVRTEKLLRVASRSRNQGRSLLVLTPRG